MKYKKNLLSVIFGAITSTTLISCNSGSTNPNSVPSLVTIKTFDYNPGYKTGVNISIGGSNPIIAEVDSGSNLTVVNESAILGSNITMTSESLQLIYGGGTNTVKGFIGYGSVSFTTDNGQVINSSPQTPILVVTSGTVNLGGGNNAILGMQMNNQTSVRLFLPYPYNQMMILNRPQNQLSFGELNFQQLSSFANIKLESEACQSHNVQTLMNNVCWMTESIPVKYKYSQNGLPDGDVTYGTLFDSGAGNAMFQFSSPPSWLTHHDSIITNVITASVDTLSRTIPLPLPETLIYQENSDDKVNAGNNLFNTYQVLFNQRDGIIGLQSADNPL